jgi:hypothetical protein
MRFLVSLVPRRARLRWLAPVVAAVLAAGTAAVAPGVAGAQGCPEADPTYMDACGPTFQLPAWGDGAGWTDPSQYSTIQLADVNGDGRDELIARNDQGLEIWSFDTTLGQWQPQVDASANQQVLTDFRSPLPNETPATDWTKPEYYSTIQAADIDNQPGEEILARAADGMRVYKYAPPGGGTAIDGGTWARIGSGGPYSDADGYSDPSLYSTIQVARFTPAGPLLFARQHVSGPLTPTRPSTLTFYRWNGQWERVPDQPSDSRTLGVAAWDDQVCSVPSCYLTIQTATIGPDFGPPEAATVQILGRDDLGVGSGLDGESWPGGTRLFEPAPDGSWHHSQRVMIPSRTRPFSNVDLPGDGNPDCPFSAGGATGAGSGDCLGVSPSYYETLQPADIDGEPGDELLARASDGLRVRKWSIDEIDNMPPLPDLAGDAASVQPGLWGSIRTAYIDGDKKQEVLALTGGGLQVWSYNPASTSWQRWQPSTVLALTGDWLTKPEYFATIRTGDVDGDGRDDVIARGQFGIRTWFYDRRGTGGWERYLAEGYPDFPSRQCPAGVTGPCGQQGAYNALNGLAVPSGTVRGVWTAVTAPDAGTLSTLQTDLPKPIVGNCPTQTRLEPPAYAACIPPANSTTFTADEWTAVVNQLLSEAYYAEQVVDHFGDVETMRKGLFESQDGALPAIGAELQLAGADGNTTQFDFQSFFAGTSGIAASIAGLSAAAGPEVSAALWVASEIISMLPSASQTASSTFQATYAGLLGKLATAQDEMADEVTSQRQQVLGDQGLLGVVGQLRGRGTWKPDVDGLQSASRQAFVLETYKALMPTIYDRYQVTNCIPSRGAESCSGPSPGPGVIGDSQNFTTIGLPPTTSGGLSVTPCIYHTNTGSYYCHYETNSPPAEVMNRIWGPMDPSCDYKPPKKTTLWHFGCSLGVPAATSIRADSADWAFATHTGNPVTFVDGSARRAVSATPGVVRATVARAGASARAARKVLDPLRFTGRVALARGLRVRRARVVVERALFEHGRREELARTRSGRRLRPFALRHLRGGLFASRRRGGPRVRLRLRQPDGRASARVGLRLTRVRTQDIRALCTVLPARVSLAGRPLELETRLRLRDGAQTSAITMRQRWRCVRDSKGEFTGIRPVKPKRPAARPGLSVGINAPRVSASGRRATVRVTVANLRRKRPTRVVSSLWDLDITATAGGLPRTIEIKELRARRSRTLRLSLPVPRSARGKVCVQVAVTAASARGAGTRRCARIAGAPRFTG